MKKKSLPTLSIVTPSYNQGQFIERTILSVLDQNYPNLQYLIIDGGSTDQTVPVLKKYQKQLTWISEPDAGQADAINKGLRRGTGSVLAYLNSDDTYQPGALRAIGQHFAEHPETQFVYGRGRLIDALDREIGFYNDSQTDEAKLFAQCAISQPTAFWTRKVLDTVGFFDPSFQYTMDYEYWMRVAKVFPLTYLPELVVANTRIHADAKTSSQTHKLHLEAVRASLLHYGKVHYDWISTLADGEAAQYSGDSFGDHTRYILHMIMKTLYYHARYNREVPAGPAAKLLLHRVNSYFRSLFAA